MARVSPAPRIIPNPSELKGSFPHAIKTILTQTNKPIEPTRTIKLESLRMPCPSGCKVDDVTKDDKENNNHMYHALGAHPTDGICLFLDQCLIFRSAFESAEQAVKLF